MNTKKTWWITGFVAICFFATTIGAAWASSVEIIGPVTLSFQGNGQGEFDYYNYGASGNYLQTSPFAIPAQITAVSPANAWNTILPTTSLPADINFDLSGSGQFNSATVNGSNFTQILNLQWGASFVNDSGSLSITGITPLTISGTINGTNATIQGSFNQMSFYQTGEPMTIGLSQPQLLSIYLNTTSPLTLDTTGMLNTFAGDWSGGLQPSQQVPEPSETVFFGGGVLALGVFVLCDYMKKISRLAGHNC